MMIGPSRISRVARPEETEWRPRPRFETILEHPFVAANGKRQQRASNPIPYRQRQQEREAVEVLPERDIARRNG